MVANPAHWPTPPCQILSAPVMTAAIAAACQPPKSPTIPNKIVRPSKVSPGE